MCYRGNHSTLGTSVKCGMRLTHQLCKPMAYTVSSRTFQHLTHTYTTDAVTTAPAADAAWPENPGSASLKRRMKRTQAALVRVPPQRADSLGGVSLFPSSFRECDGGFCTRSWCRPLTHKEPGARWALWASLQQLGIWNGNDGWLLSAPWQSQPFQQLQQLLVITLWFENNES